MSGLAIRSHEAERMDDEALDEATFAAVLADLGRANRLTLAARPTLAFLDRAAPQAEKLRVLDVGFGGGDMLRAISRWSVARGVTVELVGVDLNPRSRPAAVAAGPSPVPIDYRIGDYRDQTGPWDVVLSSLVAHHMGEDELVGFLDWMEASARVGWFVNDLRRSAVAQAGFRLLAAANHWHPIVRHDGALSVARSFRPSEWRVWLDAAGLAHAGVRLERWVPYRLCVARLR